MAAHPDAVMARPSLVFPDGKPQQLPKRQVRSAAHALPPAARLSFWKGQNDHYLMLDEGPDQAHQEFCTGSFSGVLAPSRRWAALTSYFMYVEDADHPEDAHPGQGIWCPSIPSTPGTALPTGISSPPPSGNPGNLLEVFPISGASSGKKRSTIVVLPPWAAERFCLTACSGKILEQAFFFCFFDLRVE